MGLEKPLIVVCMALAPMAWAQESEDTLNGEVELGVLVSTGNTEETNMDGGLLVEQETPDWRNSGDFSSYYSEADDETTAEEYEAMLETNYKYDDHQYWYLRGSWEDDRFSGYDFQSTVSTGYGNRIWRTGERSFLDLSAGIGYRYNKLEAVNAQGEDAEQDTIARLAARFDYALSENALFRQKLSTEIGLDENNTVSESETSLRSNILGSLDMKVAFLVEHESDPPKGAESTDTETTLSLVYGF